MENILSGFAAVVFVLFNFFAIYSYWTTPEEQVPGALKTKRAKATYYYGLIMLAACIGFSIVGVSWILGKWILASIGVQ